jgi:hypothetical protein
MIQEEASGKSADEGLVARRVSLRAHFGSRGRAEQAASAVAQHARIVYVNVGHASPFRPARPAQDERFSPVRLTQPHWLAFGAGLAVGTAALELIFPGLLASIYLGPAMVGNLVTAFVLISGMALATGWLAGALVRFCGAYRARPATSYRPRCWDRPSATPNRRCARPAQSSCGSWVTNVLRPSLTGQTEAELSEVV